MQERLGKEYPAFLTSYGRPPEKGLRVNTLKLSAEEFASRAPFPLGEKTAWEEDGFYISEEKPGGDVYHFAGLYYLQEPSAMCAAPLLGAGKGERVLDLCAAPGGKTVQLAAGMGGSGVLIANEIVYDRAKILSQNVERMGIANCAVTSASPARLKESFPAYFDKILVDAPCSGEGMFKKEKNAVPEWSEENVERCAERQRHILDCAAEMLAGGGKMVYSTCTFAEEEDEWQIGDFLERHGEFALLGTKKLYPHTARGEGHFAALLEKREGERLPAKKFPVAKNAAAERAFREFAADFFETPLLPDGALHTLADGRMYLVPADMPCLSGVSLLRLGVELGEYDGKRFKPAHALAMAFGTRAKRKLSLSRGDCETYLRGGTVPADMEDGWAVVCVEEFPLGLGKAVNGVLKNHLPKALRLLRT